jgi:mannose-1-phosphate guanylyltransferase
MSPQIRHALVLAAGLGTRLRPLTAVRAKPAIPVAGDPIVRRIARWLSGCGVADLVVNLHHLPETIARVLGDGSDLGARVRYSWEQPVVLGSAGGTRLALPMLEADTFFIVNGDTLTNVDLGQLAAAHEASSAPGGSVTLALTPNRDPARYGGVRLDGQSRVLGFVGRGSAAESFHFIGVQAASAGVFRSLPENRVLGSIGDVYDRLIASRPGSIRGFVSDAAFWDIGTVADYIATCQHFQAFQALETETPAASARSGIDAAACVTHSIVWDDVEVGAKAKLDTCILTDGVRVPVGAVYRRTILMRGARGAVEAVPLVEDRG